MEQTRSEPCQKPGRKRNDHGKPDRYPGRNAHDADRAAKPERAVNGQVRHIQDAEGDVDADAHDGPDEPLRDRAGHGVEECCDVHG